MGESKQNNRFLNQTILIPKNFFNVKRDVYSSLVCSVRHITKRKKYAFVKFSRISQHGKWICFKGVRINHTFPVHQLVLFVVLYDRNSIVLRISDIFVHLFGVSLSEGLLSHPTHFVTPPFHFAKFDLFTDAISANYKHSSPWIQVRSFLLAIHGNVPYT